MSKRNIQNTIHLAGFLLILALLLAWPNINPLWAIAGVVPFAFSLAVLLIRIAYAKNILFEKMQAIIIIFGYCGFLVWLGIEPAAFKFLLFNFLTISILLSIFVFFEIYFAARQSRQYSGQSDIKKNKRAYLLLALPLVYYVLAFFIFEQQPNQTMHHTIAIYFVMAIVFQEKNSQALFCLFAQKHNTTTLPQNLFLTKIKQFQHIKTFVFSYEQVLSTEKFRLARYEHRKTIRSEMVKKTFSTLLGLSPWSMPLDKLTPPLNEHTFKFSSQTNQQVQWGDANNDTYVLSTVPLSKDKEEDTDFSFFLYKNQLLIGQFLIKRNYNTQWDELLETISKLYNTVVVSRFSGKLVAQNLPLYFFDRLYADLTPGKQNDLIRQLHQKAHTVLITASVDAYNAAPFALKIGNKASHEIKLDQAPQTIYQLLLAAQKLKTATTSRRIIQTTYNIVAISMVAFQLLDIISATLLMVSFNLVSHYSIYRHHV